MNIKKNSVIIELVLIFRNIPFFFFRSDDVIESEQLAARVSAGAVRGRADDVDLLAALVGGQVYNRKKTIFSHLN